MERKTRMTDVKHFLKDHAYQNIPLNFGEAYELGDLMLKGCQGDSLAQIQSIAVLCALHTKATYSWQWSKRVQERHGHELPDTAASQIAGICAAVFQDDIAKSKFGFLQPKVSYAMDNCGMGGDLVVTANVSTIAAFIAAAAGIPMCKHGSPANADAGRHGSSDFIDLCGINPLFSKQEAESCLESLNFCYTEALNRCFKMIHWQTHKVARLPHMNDIIGPITNPLDPKLMTRRVLGVNHLISPRVVADAYCILNNRGITFLKHGLFVRGFIDSPEGEGVDEVSICKGGTQVAELKHGNIKEYHLKAEDFGLEPVAPELISPPGEKSKGEFSLLILKRKVSGAPLQMAAANAALLFYLAERSLHLKPCYKEAEEILMSGRAYEKMLEVREMFPKAS